MNSTNSIFIVITITVVLMSALCGAIGLGTFSEDIGDTLEEPDAWDVATFVGGGFWGLASFTIDNIPTWVSLMFWTMLLIWTWCLVALIRGIS